MKNLTEYKDRTESEIAKLLATLDRIAFFDSSFDTTNHHGTYADCHNAAKLGALDGHDLPCVLAVNI